MLKEKNQQMHSSLNFKKKIIEEFNLKSRQVESLETYIKEIIKYKNHKKKTYTTINVILTGRND